MLDSTLPRWLGRVSYSLYLVHLPIFLALYPVLAGRVPFPAAALLLIVASLAAAAVMHRLVEAPATRLGRRLTRPVRAAGAGRLGVSEVV